nr:MAG TPA: hypothetical protein [Caudoviricetes sp.]
MSILECMYIKKKINRAITFEHQSEDGSNYVKTLLYKYI